MNTNSKRNSLGLAVIAGLIASASADVFIYEPFDYDPTTEINNGAFFGDGNQAGGLGLGEWSQVDNNGNSTPESPPVNEGDVADEGVMFTDSLGNELPVAGNAYERRNRVGQVAVSSPIESSATMALTADNSTMWMTFLFQDFGFSGPDFGIGLHSENMVGNDNQDLVAPGFGVGFGIVSTAGQDRNIGTAVYNDTVNFTRQFEDIPTFNGPGASDVFLLAMKVNWNPAGTPDEIFVFIIDDLTTEPEEADALASDTFDWDLATQQSLDVLNFSDTQVGYVDEIRVGTSFSDVTNGVAPRSFNITAIDYSPGDNMLTLTWDSTEGTDYAIRFSRDMTNWDADLDDGVPGAAGDSTTRTFDLTAAGLAGAERVFFRVERQ